MKTIVSSFAVILFMSITTFTFSQDKEGASDPAQFKRVSSKYALNDYIEDSDSYNISKTTDDGMEVLDFVSGKLKDYDYLNYDSNTFSSTDAIVGHYSDLITQAGGELVFKGDGIGCSGVKEEGAYSGSGTGAIYKLRKNEKDTWIVVLAINVGNYKLLMIE